MLHHLWLGLVAHREFVDQVGKQYQHGEFLAFGFSPSNNSRHASVVLEGAFYLCRLAT